MSANVETMFYAGEKPWHGLGRKVDEALTSEQALEMAGLNWQVVQKPVQIIGGKAIPNMKANVRDTDGQFLGMVTDRYRIVQNSEAFAFTDMLLGEGVRYETAGSLASGKRVWMLARMDSVNICGDNVEPYLVFTNSHDGSGAVKVAVTPIRVVCQNTLTLALSNASRTWSTKHTGDIQSKLDDARNTLQLASTYMQELEKQADELTQIVVLAPQFADFVKKMFPLKEDASERQIANVERQRMALADLYNHKEDIQRFHGTAYGVINAVADMIPHFIPARQTRNYQENNFMSIVDGGKGNLMEMACAYFR